MNVGRISTRTTRQHGTASSSASTNPVHKKRHLIRGTTAPGGTWTDCATYTDNAQRHGTTSAGATLEVSPEVVGRSVNACSETHRRRLTDWELGEILIAAKKMGSKASL
eukprot:gnl/TRDRNA2_/TRDRNA2_121002_c0_seq1.p1 gnl/TRDRNA2_/TRDRNA2_121002_c0~~gnl/TRDRNA2_/TRDRNA2_121002_c0_seq1.p1  ORF type:complete len:109 (+),score=5.89 gnl/TRDRNA2_/TRDRNA2_121002_c0_seq1:2-328(+)